MALIAYRLMTEKLFDVREIFQRIDPKVSSQVMKPGFEKTMKVVLEAQLQKQFPQDSRLSSIVPTIQSQFLSWTDQELPEFVKSFMGELVNKLDDVFDFEFMITNELNDDKQILNDVFLTVGAKEMQFIKRAGFYFGALFGLLFLPVFMFFPEWYILPIVGAVVGYSTNAIALKMMFSPTFPHIFHCCGRKINIQGLFLQRQQEASATFAAVITQKVLNSRYMFHYMLNGPKRNTFRELLKRRLNEFIDKVLGSSSTVVRAYMGEDEFIKMREEIEQASLANVEDIFVSFYPYADKALDLETTIREKMQELPPDEFEGVLHPAFEEDEIKLIIVGAVLGMIVGFVQSTFT